MVALLLLAAARSSAEDPQASARSAPPPGTVLPLSGPSVLRGLALTVDMSPLGRLGGEATPGSQLPPAFREAVRKALKQAGANDEAARRSLQVAIAISGADLYRINCRACHGPTGIGKPPAIASIIGPSRALSPAQHEQAMKAAGAAPRHDLAVELAKHAEASLRERLTHGGKKPALPYLETMPPFAWLTEPEVAALQAYLETLGGLPSGGSAPRTAGESVLGIGEQVVRGTCRICHDATGPAGGHTLLMAGLVPALANLPEQLSMEGVVHKVRHGWTSMAGMEQPASRMPVFGYLSDEEVAAAYLYLAYLPPQPAR
jgi:mono/diheme cytochrome c family protein